MGIADIARRALSYDMPGMVLDGNDVVAVYSAAHEAVARARAGDGPSLLECKTYRWHSHYESSNLPDLRPVEEIEAWKQKCPVANFEWKLLEQGIMTTQDFEECNREILAQIDDAVDYAMKSPLPDPESAMEDVFSA
jgi:pyruvate dehydrogenase E1 component alpha subunit